MTRTGEKLIAAAKEAVKIAQCDHALVMTPTQPKDNRRVCVFCPRCEATFTKWHDEE